MTQGLSTELTARLVLACDVDMAAVERALALEANARTALEASTPVPAGVAAHDDGGWDNTRTAEIDQRNAPLARFEGRVSLELIVHRCPHLRLDESAADLHWGALFRGVRRLPLLFS